jgi:signal transduction histidine kinase
MGAAVNLLTFRMILVGLAIHAVLLPLLFYGLYYIVRQTHEERFIDDARKYSRFIADVIESEDMLGDNSRVANVLDSAALGSGSVYSVLWDGDAYIRSVLQLVQDEDFQEDFAFGQHGDHVYFLSTPVHTAGHQAMLMMGYDELQTIEQTERAMQRLVIVLVVYLMVMIFAITLLAMRLIKPIKSLQDASRRIANGHYYDQLQVDTQITEVRELADDLDSMRSKLVGMNLSLTQEIAERIEANKQQELLKRKLLQARKLETVGIMAGGIAHEFNNILLPIFLYTEQAMDDLPKDSPVRAQLEHVLKSSNRAKNLVQQILTFSRQSGKQEFKPVDMKPVVEESLELLRALIPSTVELSRHLTDDECMVLADRNQIHQMVMNLCSNAYLALDEIGGKITVELDRYSADRQISGHPDLKPGKYIRMSVKDTGRGMDRGNLDRVFEPFYTTRAVGKGTGLGLSVVHGIVISHNGEITVESEPGKGTVFNVYLPEIGRSEQ